MRFLLVFNFLLFWQYIQQFLFHNPFSQRNFLTEFKSIMRHERNDNILKRSHIAILLILCTIITSEESDGGLNQRVDR
jgi:hypothetical protein